MRIARVLLTACAVLSALALPVGVVVTALLLEENRHLPWAAIGLTLLAAAMVVLELAHAAGRKSQGPAGSGVLYFFLTAIDVIFIQLIILLLFSVILDGGVHLRACCFAYLGYVAGVLLVLIRRAKALTWGDRLFLRWGWVPIVVVGLPLFIRVWKAKGLI